MRGTFFSVTWEMIPECLWTICFTAEINIRKVIKLLLSSDGLLDKIEPEEILGLLQQDCGADVLTEEAVKKGAGDNVTAVLLEIQ